MSGIGIGHFLGKWPGSGSRYWTPLTLVVEDAAPTHIVMTGAVANTNAVAGDFTPSVNGTPTTFSSISRSNGNKTITGTITAVAYGDVVTVTHKGKSYPVTNNVLWIAHAPINLIQTIVNSTRIDFTWTNVDTNGSGVSIERSTDGVTFASIATVALGVAAYSNTGLTINTTYYYRAKAYAGSTYSNPSNMVFGRTPLGKDSFTDTNGTLLQNHTPDAGAAFTIRSGTWTLNNGVVAVDTTAVNSFATKDAGVADIDISVDIFFPTTYTNFAAGLVFRYTDTTHYWVVWAECDAATNLDLRLFCGSLKANFLFAPGTSPHNVWKKLRVKIVGDVISVYFDHVLAFAPITDSTYNTKTEVGMANSVGGAYMPLALDNFNYTGAFTPVHKGVCLCFDDQWTSLGTSGINNMDSWITADAILKSYGWKMSMAISTNPANTTNQQDIDEITADQAKVNSLISKGHQIVNHTVRHIALTAYLAVPHTRQEYYDNCIMPLQTILTSLFANPPTTYRYSNWYGDDDPMSAIIDGLDYRSSGAFNIAVENKATYPSTLSDVCYQGARKTIALDIAPYTGTQFSDAEITALLDYARDNNLILNIFSHNIIAGNNPGAFEVSIARMQTICQYIIDNNMTFYQLNELTPQLFNF